MASKTRSLQRGIAHKIMEKAGINRPNERRGQRNISKNHPHKAYAPVSYRSFFAQNWRDILNDKKSRRLLYKRG